MKLPALSFSRRGMIVGLAQLALVGSLAGKLGYDRATSPRVWVRCTGVDPDAPIRGRYVSLRLAVPFSGNPVYYGPARLRVDGNQLVAEHAPQRTGGWEPVRFAGSFEGEKTPLGLLDPPVAVFLPEHVPDPTLRKRDEELWIEVTVLKEGPPRPIRLGVKRGNATIAPLSLD